MPLRHPERIRSHPEDRCGRDTGSHGFNSGIRALLRDATLAPAEFTDTYNAANNRTMRVSLDGDKTVWSYDAAEQLVTEAFADNVDWDTLTTDEWDAMTLDQWSFLSATNPPDRAVTFTYDDAGNRLTKDDGSTVTTYTYNAANRLLTSDDGSGVTTYTYDENGNQRTIEAPSGDVTTQTWSYENQLIEVEHPSGDVVTYTYAPVNRDSTELRLTRETDTGLVWFLWDNQNLIRESDDLSVTVATYTVVPEMYGDVVSQTRDDVTSYHHYDPLGSTRALTDETELVTDDYAYAAYGDLESSTGTTENPHQWVGRLGYYKDEDSTLYNLRQRDYRPTTGRFASEDPLAFAGGDSNFYRYVMNNPVNDVDPSGEASIKCKFKHARNNAVTWRTTDCSSGAIESCCNRVKPGQGAVGSGSAWGLVGWSIAGASPDQSMEEAVAVQQAINLRRKQERTLAKATERVLAGNIPNIEQYAYQMLMPDGNVQTFTTNINAQPAQQIDENSAFPPFGHICGQPGSDVCGVSRIKATPAQLHSWIQAEYDRIWQQENPNILERIHFWLDFAGLIPVAGALFDAANGLIYTFEGDAANAAISFAGLAPIVGDAAVIGRTGKYLVKNGEKLAVESIQTAAKAGECSEVKLFVRTSDGPIEIGSDVPLNKNTLKFCNPNGKRKLLAVKNADEVNAGFTYDNPPYMPGTKVVDFETGKPEEFVRFASRNENTGKINTQGQWLMKRDAIKGLTAEQVIAKYQIPNADSKPLYIIEVRVPSCFKMRYGAANPKVLDSTPSTGLARQYQILDRFDKVTWGEPQLF